LASRCLRIWAAISEGGISSKSRSVFSRIWTGSETLHSNQGSRLPWGRGRRLGQQLQASRIVDVPDPEAPQRPTWPCPHARPSGSVTGWSRWMLRRPEIPRLLIWPRIRHFYFLFEVKNEGRMKGGSGALVIASIEAGDGGDRARWRIGDRCAGLVDVACRGFTPLLTEVVHYAYSEDSRQDWRRALEYIGCDKILLFLLRCD
jgi:hypothetical protein